MKTFSLDTLTVLEATPPEMALIAAEAGYEAISPITNGLKFLAPPLPPLSRGCPMTRRMAAHLRDTGVVVNNLDGFSLNAGTRVADFRESLELGAELQARNIVTFFFDSDLNRAFDNFCELASAARVAGLRILLEFTPLSYIESLDAAINLLRRARQPNAAILVDVLHLMQSGGSPADIAGVDPSLIGAAQICDGPLNPTLEQYRYNAFHERQIPGEGELPLVAFLRALPSDIVIGIEVPLKSWAVRGVPALERARRGLAAAHHLLRKSEEDV
jgi:sugar phosphate isomerase/epimerase